VPTSERQLDNPGAAATDCRCEVGTTDAPTPSGSCGGRGIVVRQQRGSSGELG
jgi:hypothetical protein